MEPQHRSTRRELQGPRPTPLVVRKDSHKIKKLPPRPPVIIYSVSPKVIHTSPTGFMSLVQRLTGTDSTTFRPTPSNASAAKLSISEKTQITLDIKHSSSSTTTSTITEAACTGVFDFSDIRLDGGLLQSISSPAPAGLLRPFPPTLFSPISDDPSPLVSLYHQQHDLDQDYLSALHQQLGYEGEGGIGGGNSNILSSPTSATAAFLSPNPMLSPASIEFLTRLLDQ